MASIFQIKKNEPRLQRKLHLRGRLRFWQIIDIIQLILTTIILIKVFLL